MTFKKRIESLYDRSSASPKADFAKKVGIHVSTIDTWSDKKPPGGKILRRIKEQVGVSIDWLLTGEGKPSPGKSSPRPGQEVASYVVAHEGEKKSRKILGVEPPGVTPEQFKRSETLTMAAWVLESRTSQAEEHIEKLEQKNSEVEKRINELEERLKSDRIREEDDPSRKAEILNKRAFGCIELCANRSRID